MKSEECSECFASMNPDKLNKVRSLTSWSRTLKLYIATKNPKKKFLEILIYILTVYTGMQYTVRTQFFSGDGSRHVSETI